MFWRTLFIMAGCFFLVIPAMSQTAEPDDSTTQKTMERRSSDDEMTGVYYVDQPTDSTIERQKPTIALFKSMLVPGWGQIGNKKYIKAGVIITLEVTLVGTIMHYADKTSDARDAFDSANDTNRARMFTEYMDAKSQRNRFGWMLGTLVFLSMFDAFVDAHLAPFPKYDKQVALDISMIDNETPGLVLSLRF
jgi:hypothetical protein